MYRPIVRILIAAVIVGSYSQAFADPLHEAASKGEMGLAGKLIQDGANVEALDEHGETPLTASALAGHPDMVRFLLDHGAKVMGRNEGGFTVLHAAAYTGHVPIVDLVLKRGARINDQSNKAKITPLHAAAERDHLNVATLLLNHGARVDLKERNGWTPLARATFKRFGRIVVLLRKHDAKCPTERAVGPANNGFCRDPMN